jgi:hypothetical protein
MCHQHWEETSPTDDGTPDVTDPGSGGEAPPDEVRESASGANAGVWNYEAWKGLSMGDVGIRLKNVKDLSAEQRPQLRAWSEAEYDPEQPELGGDVGSTPKQCDKGEVHAIAMRASSYFISQFLPREQQIGQLEAIAVLLACLVLAPFLQGIDILWGTDNTSAEASLARGYSPKQDTADIAAATAPLLNALDTRPRFSR